MNKTRYARGQVIAHAGVVRQVTQTHLWKVGSESDRKRQYNVVERTEGLSCDCKDFEFGNVCKHCHAVMITIAGVKA